MFVVCVDKTFFLPLATEVHTNRASLPARRRFAPQSLCKAAQLFHGVSARVASDRNDCTVPKIACDLIPVAVSYDFPSSPSQYHVRGMAGAAPKL